MTERTYCCKDFQGCLGMPEGLNSLRAPTEKEALETADTITNKIHGRQLKPTATDNSG